MPRISEQRRQERRRTILDAARTLFTEQGFHATSMDDIIDRAGMSAGGVYGYFASKDAIITAVAEETVTAVAARLEGLRTDLPLSLAEAVAVLLHTVDSAADSAGRLALQVWAEAQRDPAIADLAAREIGYLRDTVVQLVQRTADPARLPEGVDPPALAQLLFSLAVGHLVQRRILHDVDVEHEISTVAALLGVR